MLPGLRPHTDSSIALRRRTCDNKKKLAVVRNVRRTWNKLRSGSLSCDMQSFVNIMRDERRKPCLGGFLNSEKKLQSIHSNLQVNILLFPPTDRNGISNKQASVLMTVVESGFRKGHVLSQAALNNFLPVPTAHTNAWAGTLLEIAGVNYPLFPLEIFRSEQRHPNRQIHPPANGHYEQEQSRCECQNATVDDFPITPRGRHGWNVGLVLFDGWKQPTVLLSTTP